jgi:hypothetical protein
MQDCREPVAFDAIVVFPQTITDGMSCELTPQGPSDDQLDAGAMDRAAPDTQHSPIHPEKQHSQGQEHRVGDKKRVALQARCNPCFRVAEGV